MTGLAVPVEVVPRAESRNPGATSNITSERLLVAKQVFPVRD